MIRSGRNRPADFKVGDTDVAGVYLGDTQLWVRAAAPAFTTFDLSPEFRLDSQGGNLILSWNVSNATHLKLTEALADGTVNTLIDEPVGTGQGQRAPVGNRSRVAPTQNANYTIDINNAMDIHNLRSKQFYRVISPTLSLDWDGADEAASTRSGTRIVQGVAVPFEQKSLRLTRAGTPLPSLMTLQSSAGTAISVDLTDSRYDGLTVIRFHLTRNLTSSQVSDTITARARTSVPANLFTDINVSDTLALTWDTSGA